MDDSACPRCRTTKYRNPSLKLLVNICGHTLCENCVDLLFVRGSADCTVCGTSLRRNNFRIQQFEDSSVEKEIDIRRRILKDFNKKEEDFSTLREFNDYLEMVENIIFSLVNEVDMEETRQQIEIYKRDNKDIIRKNRNKLSHDAEYLESLLEQEQQNAKLHKQIIEEEEQQTKQTKRKQQDALIDELMSSDLPADHIVSTHQREVEATKPKVTKFSTGAAITQKSDVYLPIPTQVEGEQYIYTEDKVDLYGPEIPQTQDFVDKYLADRPSTEGELAGGYRSEFGYHRAINDALCGLFFSFDIVKNYIDQRT